MWARLAVLARLVAMKDVEKGEMCDAGTGAKTIP